MKLSAYIVSTDAGLAPNPFWGVCTLAVCKPRIRRFAEVGPGDLLSKMHRWTLRQSRSDVLEDPEGIARFASRRGSLARAEGSGASAGEEIA